MLTPSSLPARLLAAFLTLGAAFLAWRALFLIGAGFAAQYVLWLVVLTGLELVLALVIFGLSLAWLATGSARWAGRTLRLTAAIILLHAVRVAVFALGRIGPWPDLDLRPEHRPMPPEAWSLFDVWFASVMAGLSLLVLLGVLTCRHSRAGRG